MRNPRTPKAVETPAAIMERADGNGDMRPRGASFQAQDVAVVQLAQLLSEAGLSIHSTVDGDDGVDAMIEITERVHVTIPTFGGRPGVVREEASGDFIFYPEPADTAGLIAQIADALADAEQETAPAVIPSSGP